ncbi:DUF494 domain-containing protein [bacterium]|nr:DUF494 domain-containing protein [bacterium]
MNDKTLEVIIMLLGHLRENDLDAESLKDFSESLVLHGFNEHDVAEALSWLFEKLNFVTVKSTEIAEQGDKSFRILHDYERMKIPPDVYGYLLRLKHLTLISASEMEKVIDYLVLAGDTVTGSDIDEIVANILFKKYE